MENNKQHSIAAEALKALDRLECGLYQIGNNEKYNTPIQDFSIVRTALQRMAEQQVHGWRGIESAPRDGTRILLRYVHLTEGQFEHGQWCRDFEIDDDPTHWMPLPRPPIKQSEE